VDGPAAQPGLPGMIAAQGPLHSAAGRGWHALLSMIVVGSTRPPHITHHDQEVGL